MWQADPVTKTYLKCLGWFKQDIADQVSNGSCVDSSSADLTHAMVHRNLGQQDGISDSTNVDYLFDRYGMILVKEKEEDDDVQDT